MEHRVYDNGAMAKIGTGIDFCGAGITWAHYDRDVALAVLDAAGLPDMAPHDGIEAQLMARALKPLAIFTDTVPSSWRPFWIDEFGPLIEAGRAVRRGRIVPNPLELGGYPALRTMYVALTEEAWRIDRAIELHQTADQRPEEIDTLLWGRLLGYTEAQVATALLRSRRQRRGEPGPPDRRTWFDDWLEKIEDED